MPKIKLPDHVKRQYARDEKARELKDQEQRQAISEHTAKVLQERRKKQESDYKLKLKKQSDERKESGDVLNSEIAELKAEGWPYSMELARQKTQNRIEVLTMDKDHYTKEIKKFQDQELNAGFLEDTLSSINDELDELKIDIELSAE